MRDLGRACSAASPPLYGSTRPLHHPKTAISTLNSPPDRAPPLATRASVLAPPLAPRAIRPTPASPSRPLHSLIRQVGVPSAGPTFRSEGSQPCSVPPRPTHRRRRPCHLARCNGCPRLGEGTTDGAGLAISLGCNRRNRRNGRSSAPRVAPGSPSRSAKRSSSLRDPSLFAAGLAILPSELVPRKTARLGAGLAILLIGSGSLPYS